MTAPSGAALRIAMIHQLAGGGATVAARELEAGADRFGWQIAWFPTAATRDPAALMSALQEFAPDVLHLHCWYSEYPIGTMRDWLARWPAAFTVHDVFVVNQFGEECWECARGPTCLGCPAVPRLKRWRPNRRVRSRWNKRRTFSRAPRPHLIFPSAWMQRRLSRSEWAACPSSVIPYALDPRPWESGPANAPAPRDSNTVLFAGNMYSEQDHRKGLPDLLAAWPAVRAVIPEARLRIAGQISSSEALPEGIEVLGSVARDAMRPLLQRSTVFCLPSRGDNSPLAVLEAMAAGTPVLATSVGGIPEQIGDGAGMLVPSKNPSAMAEGLIALLEQPELRSTLCTTAHARVRSQHDPKAILESHHELYERLRNGNAR